jgi:hypothetical protein
MTPMVEVVRPEYIGEYLCESNRKKRHGNR